MQDIQAPDLHGFVDSLRNKELLGWCWEKGSPKTLNCELMIGEFLYETTAANLFRSDLLQAGINDGRHAFRFDLRSLDLDAFITNNLNQISVRVAGTDFRLEASSFIPFFPSKGSRLIENPYLANFFGAQEKIDCYNTCNKFLFKEMNESLHIPKLLWMRNTGKNCTTMVLKHADFAPLEGELSISVIFGGATIYSISFSIIHGRVVGRDEPFVLFIGGLQGRPNSREKIAVSAETNDGVHPRMLLFTAILALCEIWNITTIAAISARQHISCNKERLASFLQNYDRFWKDLGGMVQDADHRIYFIPANRNSLLKYNENHGRRSLQRRFVRDKIQQEILRNL